MKKLNFVAIDFETMTPELTSACAVGLVKVVDNVVAQKFYSLIKPIPDERTSRNTFVHGITDKMVENAPTWDELFPTIRGFFDSNIVVCHNASTDIRVLSMINSYYNISMSNYDVIDTLHLTGRSLVESCSCRGIDFGVHHDALCDATACANLLLEIEGVTVKESEYIKLSESEKKARTISSETKRPLEAEQVENPDTPFFAKKVVITGVLDAFPYREDLAYLLKKYGADINGSISGKTDIVIMGKGAGPSKLKKIEEFQSKGYDIHVFNENDLLEIIEEYNIQ